MSIKKKANRFEFNIDYQWDIIRFTLTDRDGYKALRLYNYDYFDLDDQQIIIRGVQRFFKRRNRIPSEASVLREELRQLFKTKDYVKALKEEDRVRISKKVTNLYKRPLKDGSEIIEKCRMFASYVAFKKELENIDLNNFDAYGKYVKKIQTAINIGNEVDVDRGSFMVSGVKSRLADRKFKETSFPTPIKQLNKLSNSLGYPRGSIFVLMDKPKMGKTFTLVNLARGYLKLRKKVIYFDLENGEDPIKTRIDQSVIKEKKRQIESGEHDARLNKIYRKYARIGSEIYVIRMPNGSTTLDFQNELDKLYNEFGLKFEVAIIDYVAIMGSLSGHKDEIIRISDAYLDIKNWANHNQFESVWTGHHVKREAYKRRYTKYESSDVAKCTDIERHIDVLLGGQQSPEEEKNNVYRIEVIVQRDGAPSGTCLFWEDKGTQRLEEFTLSQREEYFAQMREREEDENTYQGDLD